MAGLHSLPNSHPGAGVEPTTVPSKGITPPLSRACRGSRGFAGVCCCVFASLWGTGFRWPALARSIWDRGLEVYHEAAVLANGLEQSFWEVVPAVLDKNLLLLGESSRGPSWRPVVPWWCSEGCAEAPGSLPLCGQGPCLPLPSHRPVRSPLADGHLTGGLEQPDLGNLLNWPKQSWYVNFKLRRLVRMPSEECSCCQKGK